MPVLKFKETPNKSFHLTANASGDFKRYGAYMENTKILKSKLIQLKEEVNSNPRYNIEFHQQKITKENMSFSGGNGRIWIQPFHSEYDISLSGKYIEEQMYKFMCDLCGKENDGHKQTKPEPRQPSWRVADFKLVEKAVYHYAKTK